MRIQKVETSPILPGMKPQNQSHGVVPPKSSVEAPAETLSLIYPSGVAPENPSAYAPPLEKPRIHTCSPEIFGV